jgi:hypothetical protein
MTLFWLLLIILVTGNVAVWSLFAWYYKRVHS